MKKGLYIVVCIAVIIMAGCQGKAKSSSTDEEQQDSTAIADVEEGDSVVPRNADELFNDFIFLFAANKKVQLKRITFPLPCSSKGKSWAIERKDWKTNYFFMEAGFYTNVVDNEKQLEAMQDTLIDSVKIERIDLPSKMVRRYSFNRTQGLWYLTRIDDTAFDEEPNSSFLNFYKKFASDDKFQAQHLEKEVEFTGPDPDDDFNSMTGYFTPETWEAFEPEMPDGIIYNMVYTPQDSTSNTKILVISGIANGMERRMTFNRRGGVWRLAKLNQW